MDLGRQQLSLPRRPRWTSGGSNSLSVAALDWPRAAETCYHPNMQPWLTIPHDIPVDQAEVWCRRPNWYTPPFLATWDLASETFITTDAGLTLPWWAVTRWANQ
jgi:hypothetical protein